MLLWILIITVINSKFINYWKLNIFLLIIFVKLFSTWILFHSRIYPVLYWQYSLMHNSPASCLSFLSSLISLWLLFSFNFVIFLYLQLSFLCFLILKNLYLQNSCSDGTISFHILLLDLPTYNSIRVVNLIVYFSPWYSKYKHKGRYYYCGIFV